MPVVIALIIFFFLCFVYYVYSLQFITRKLPPGPLMTPFGLGIIPAAIWYNPSVVINVFKLRPWELLHTFSKRFGGLFSIEMAGIYAVVVTSYELMHEMAGMEEYSMKWSHETLTRSRTFNKELGLLFVGKTEVWTEMRKFTQRTLRDFGFGKRHTMQSAIEAETTTLVNNFNEAIKSQGGIVTIRSTFVLSIVNVLWCMVAGQRYEHDDPKLVKLMDRNFAMTKSFTFAAPFKIGFPWLKKIVPSLFTEDFRIQVYNECNAFTQSLIQERRQEGTYKINPENYIDVFLQKIDESSHDDTSMYTEEQLQAMLADLLQTGFTTTNGTLNYALLYLLLNPEIQKRCQQEIDTVVPKHLTPTMEDIEKMPYFQAFVLETHRLASVVPNPIPRVAPKDWNIRGCFIPKGSMIFSNHYSVHMDEKYWGDPQVFRPERFLNEKGEFVQDKRVIHFGFGKRICIGMTLVNAVIPTILATLLQYFNFSVVPGTTEPTPEPEIGVSLSPVEFQVYVSNRVIR